MNIISTIASFKSGRHHNQTEKFLQLYSRLGHHFHIPVSEAEGHLYSHLCLDQDWRPHLQCKMKENPLYFSVVTTGNGQRKESLIQGIRYIYIFLIQCSQLCNTCCIMVIISGCQKIHWDKYILKTCTSPFLKGSAL